MSIEPFSQDAADGFVVRDDRDRLMVAMADLAYERDYAEITAEQVEARAGVAPGRFAETFDSAEECVVSAYDASVQQSFAAAVAAFARAGGEWAPAGVAALEALLTFMVHAPTLAHLACVVSPQVGEAARAYNDQAPMFFADFLRPGYVEAERLHGSLPPLELMAQIVAAGIHDLVRRFCLDRRETQLMEAHSAIAMLVIAPLLGPETALRTLREHEARRGV